MSLENIFIKIGITCNINLPRKINQEDMSDFNFNQSVDCA